VGCTGAASFNGDSGIPLAHLAILFGSLPSFPRSFVTSAGDFLPQALQRQFLRVRGKRLIVDGDGHVVVGPLDRFGRRLLAIRPRFVPGSIREIISARSSFIRKV
jgi:hypothetical protein